MICSRCGSDNCLRSHRRKVELFLAVAGILPWRCLDCRARFYARRIPLRYLPYARCPRCGNLRLLRIRRDRIGFDLGARLSVRFGARPVRCDFCRHNFTSWRLVWSPEERVEEAGRQEDFEHARE